MRSSTIVALDWFDPRGVEYMVELFPNVILPGNPDHASWQDHAEGLFVAKSKVTAEMISQAKRLKYVIRHGVGYDNIDIEACRKAGVAVCYCPGINAVSVAEVAVSLAVACSKNLVEVSRQLASGTRLDKKFKSLYSAVILTGKTVGIVGGGRIGLITAKKFHGGYDTKILLYDPFLPDILPDSNPWSTVPHTRVKTLEELLPLVDVLSLHVPLSDDTRNLIGLEQLQQMKSSAILVNTARGGVVNEPDLWRALRGGIIGSAGVDAWTQEPPTREAYGDVFDIPNLVCTPHIGGSPAEIQTQTCMAMCDRMKELVEGREALNRIV